MEALEITMADKRKDKRRQRINLVAKHAHKFNKANVHRDRTKYTRKTKHPKHTLED